MNSSSWCVQRSVLRRKFTEIKSLKADIARETSITHEDTFLRDNIARETLIIHEDTFLRDKICLPVTNRVKECVDTDGGRFDSKR